MILRQLYEALMGSHRQYPVCAGCGYAFETDDPATPCPNCGVYIYEGAQDQKYRENALEAYKELMKYVDRFDGEYSKAFNIKGQTAFDLDKILKGPLGAKLSVYLKPRDMKSSSHFTFDARGKYIVWTLPVFSNQFENPSELDDNLYTWMKSSKNVFIHEYTHFQDQRRMRGKFGTGKQHAAGTKEYFVEPEEWNAFFHELTSAFFLNLDEWDASFKDAIRKGKPEEVKEMASWVIGKNFQEFLKKAYDWTRTSPEGKFLAALDFKRDRKLKKRLYQTWQDLQKYLKDHWLRS